MTLRGLWLNSRLQLDDKQVRQIITFAGDGTLLDGSKASAEFREYLSVVPTDYLQKYIEECLRESFKDSGLALQDLVNEVGRRLGFNVTNGRYRGSTREIGFDGLWALTFGHSIVIEVKTTDVYRFDLSTIVQYREQLIEQQIVAKDRSSILIIVGREDTGGLEAQIRGSRYAWDIRLISVEALMRLVILTEEVEDPKLMRRIYEILIPKEFTKLDEIIEILFSTAEEVKYNEVDQLIQSEVAEDTNTHVSFADACIARIEQQLNQSLVKRSRATFSSPDLTLAVVCLVSKIHERIGHNRYWFAFRPTQNDFLEQANRAYVALGCGSENHVLLIPFEEFKSWLTDMNITEMDGRFYWHVEIYSTDNQLVLHRKRGTQPYEIDKFLLVD